MVQTAERYPPGACWRALIFVGALRYSRTGHGSPDTETPDDLAYRWSSSVAALVQYGIMLGILLLIARGLPKRELFALRRPARGSARSGSPRSRSPRSISSRSSTSARSPSSATGTRPRSRVSCPTAGTRAAPGIHRVLRRRDARRARGRGARRFAGWGSRCSCRGAPCSRSRDGTPVRRRARASGGAADPRGVRARRRVAPRPDEQRLPGDACYTEPSTRSR